VAAAQTVAAISARCKFIALGVAGRHDQGCTLPSFRAECHRRCRWKRSVGPRALGRVPRLAQRRGDLVFWPMRASSANQISIVSRSSAFFARNCLQARGEVFFKILDRALGLRMVTRSGR